MKLKEKILIIFVALISILVFMGIAGLTLYQAGMSQGMKDFAEGNVKPSIVMTENGKAWRFDRQ